MTRGTPSTGGTGARAMGYRRVSTREQADSGLGLSAQQTAIEATATKLGMPLVAVYTDAGISGRAKLEQRPGLADALNALRRGDVLVVAKRDRIARDSFMAVLIEREVARKASRIVSAGGEGTESDEPSAIFTRRILDAVAELERSLIAARTRAALQAKKAQGFRVGNIVRGWQLGPDGKLVPHEGEQSMIETVYMLRDQNMTMVTIAEVLYERGFRSRRGRRLCWQAIQKVLVKRA